MLYYVLYAPVAQWIERLPPEQEAVGSNPTGRINSKAGPIGLAFVVFWGASKSAVLPIWCGTTDRV